jgi:hypothetical protein
MIHPFSQFLAGFEVEFAPVSNENGLASLGVAGRSRRKAVQGKAAEAAYLDSPSADQGFGQCIQQGFHRRFHVRCGYGGPGLGKPGDQFRAVQRVGHGFRTGMVQGLLGLVGRSHPVLQRLAGGEFGHGRCRDVDGLARLRVAAGPRFPVLGREDPESRQLQLVAVGQGGTDDVQQGIQGFDDIGFGLAGLVGDGGNQFGFIHRGDRT